MTNNLSDIVSVQIQIQTPAVDSADFGTMLLIGPPPARRPEKAPPDVGVYTSLKAVKDAGWLPSDGSTPADPIYTAANVAFSQIPQPTKLMVAVRKKISDEAGQRGEPIADTLDRALNKTGWYGIAPAGIDEAEYDAIAMWTEANEKLFGFTLTGLSSPLAVNTYFRTFAIYGRTGEAAELTTPDSNLYAHVAWFAKCFEYEPGSETWALKTLSSIEPAELTGTEIAALQDARLSYYTTYAGKNITQGGKVLGDEWIDTIRFRDWLKNDMQLRIFNLLITNPKIPYTDEGIALVQNQMIASLTQGQRQGGIAGDEFDADGNKIPGFTTRVPRSFELTAADRASRRLRRCSFHARLAGAIHAVEISGTLAYDDKLEVGA